METIGRARIVAAITGDTSVLTQASNVLVFSVQSVVLVVFVGLYVAYLSPMAFLLTVGIVAAAAAIFHGGIPSCRPRERGDPYAVPEKFGNGSA